MSKINLVNLQNQYPYNIKGQELNEAIAELLGFKVGDANIGKNNPVRVMVKDGRGYPIPDYCGDWSILMPLCDEHQIGAEYEPRTDRWFATNLVSDDYANTYMLALARCLFQYLLFLKSITLKEVKS